MDKINKKEIHRIFQEIKSGEKSKLEELFLKYSQLVTNISFSIVKDKNIAEEISQMVFLKIMQLSPEKLPESGEVSWLYTLTKNQTIDFLKKQRNNIDVDSIEITDENKIDEIIDKNTFENMIDGLDDIEKEIISLKVLSNLSFREIGLMLNMPTATVQWKYYKSINTLKILLGNLAMFVIISTVYLNSIKNTNQEIEDATNNSNNTISNGNSGGSGGTGGMHFSTDFDESSFGDLEGSMFADAAMDSSTETKTIINSVIPNTVGQIFLFSVATILLITSVIFGIIFIKRQQKRKHKSSK